MDLEPDFSVGTHVSEGSVRYGTAGWSFAVHHTDRPAQAALLNLYTAMSVHTRR